MTCMYSYLIWNIGPPSLMFHRHKVPLFAFQSLLYPSDLTVYPYASHSLSCKCRAYPGYPRWLLLSLFIKHDRAPKCVVVWFIMRSFTNRSSPGFYQELFFGWLCASCQHPSRLWISHELASSWNIPFKYIRSSTFMELQSQSDMHLIACSKKLFVVCSVFFSMDFSHLVESDHEKKCIGIINDVHFITHIHAMKCTFELQNRWSHSQSWWCASFWHSFKWNYAITLL